MSHVCGKVALIVLRSQCLSVEMVCEVQAASLEKLLKRLLAVVLAAPLPEHELLRSGELPQQLFPLVLAMPEQWVEVCVLRTPRHKHPESLLGVMVACTVGERC